MIPKNNFLKACRSWINCDNFGFLQSKGDLTKIGDKNPSQTFFNSLKSFNLKIKHCLSVSVTANFCIKNCSETPVTILSKCQISDQGVSIYMSSCKRPKRPPYWNKVDFNDNLNYCIFRTTHLWDIFSNEFTTANSL